MEGRLSDSHVRGAIGPGEPLDGVTAVVVTHKRPVLAGQLVGLLLGTERFPSDRVIVVVNETGGLDDPELEAAVRMLRLADNDGPAGGFRAGMREAFSDPSTDWVYLCEDDVGLLPLEPPRVAGLLERIKSVSSAAKPVGAVVAYGRVFDRRTGNAVNFVPPYGSPHELAEVDVAAWGATLVSRAVHDAGVLPDPEWFFGFEDFDFFCRVREAGFSVMVDALTAGNVAHHETTAGRIELHSGNRPSDPEESWRAYYVARNYFSLARRHGSRSWLLAHLAYSARRIQKSSSGTERVAILRGIWDGTRGKLGKNPDYLRRNGEITRSCEQVPGAATRVPGEPGSA
jgi:GT2 family glycosyltransferase